MRVRKLGRVGAAEGAGQVGFLRGEPVRPEWMTDLLQDRLAGGYHLRVDAGHMYLYFGYEDLVLVLPHLARSREQTIRSLTTFMSREAFRRKTLTPALEAIVKGAPRRSSRRRG